MSVDPWTCVAVFAAYALLDALYAVYTDSVTNFRPGWASHTAVGIYALSAYGVKTYIENGWYVIPLLLGGWLGTYVTVVMLRRAKKKDDTAA